MKQTKENGFQGEQSIVLPAPLIKELQANPLTQDLYVTDIGFYSHARLHHRERSRGADEHILIYVANGRGEVGVATDRYTLTNNDYIIIPKNRSHYYSTQEKDAWTIYWLHFGGSKADCLSTHFGKKHTLPDHHTPQEDFRIYLFRDLMNALSMGYAKTQLEYVSLGAHHLIGSFLYPDQFMHHQHAKDRDVISKSISLMKTHVGDQLSLKELANHAGLSVAHYSKLFTQKTGFSPIDHFIHLKIQHACQLLDVSQLYVKEVAHRVGYQDPYYFSRIFKRVMQCSPLEYRKRNR